MDFLAEHQRMLELAAAGKLPNEIDDKSDVSVTVFRELFEAGLVEAIDASSMGGLAYMEPRINIAGREYLNGLQRQASDASPTGRAKRGLMLIGAWMAGILTTVVGAWILSRLGLTGG